MNFQELVEILNKADEVTTDEIDWEDVLGQIGEKVDGIKAIVDKMGFQVKWLESEIKSLQERKSQVTRNLENLKAYVNDTMAGNNFEAIPGKKWIVKTKKNPPAISVGREASVEDWEKYEKYVKRKLEYTWVKDALKKDIDMFDFPSELKEFCKKTVGTTIVFKPKELE
jgi:hypothetical protein